MYASLLAFYLHLRSSQKYAAKPETLRAHPIMRRLLELKQGISELEELDFDLSDSDESDILDDEDVSDGDDVWRSATERGLDRSELEDLLRMVQQPPEESREVNRGKKKTRQSTKVPKLKPTIVEPVYELIEPTFAKSKKSSITKPSRNDLYGEAVSLDSADIADKSGRRKALRFHTSKIESANARRQNARNALGGDDDIPYRERKKTQTENSLRKNLGVGGDDLDDDKPEQEGNGKKRARLDEDSVSGSGGSEDEDGYYSLVKKQKAQKKAEKKARYEAGAAAAK